jgi:hypothetical protein
MAKEIQAAGIEALITVVENPAAITRTEWKNGFPVPREKTIS